MWWWHREYVNDVVASFPLGPTARVASEKDHGLAAEATVMAGKTQKSPVNRRCIVPNRTKLRWAATKLLHCGNVDDGSWTSIAGLDKFEPTLVPMQEQQSLAPSGEQVHVMAHSFLRRVETLTRSNTPSQEEGPPNSPRIPYSKFSTSPLLCKHCFPWPLPESFAVLAHLCLTGQFPSRNTKIGRRCFSGLNMMAVSSASP